MFRPDELERRIVARTDAMFEQGVVEEVRAALAAGVSRTAAKALGLDEIATLPEAEARERIIIRTRRYAAYQRKWMRRIPGLVSVDGTRARRRWQMQFSKWHALGNSYLVVEQPDAGPLTPARVRRLCSVTTGIGSDGVLEITRVDGRRCRRHDLESGRLDGRDVRQRCPDRGSLARRRDRGRRASRSRRRDVGSRRGCSTPSTRTPTWGSSPSASPKCSTGSS